jgi:hypothetical protein
MDVGMMMVFASYGWDDCSDARVWEEEIRLARLAADLGFDCLWSAEHHFNDYSFVPDNLQLMTYLTALCPNIDLGTAAVILPSHDPLRVAEQAAVLDMLSKGRLRLGLGRGLSRREFAAFRLSMDESRERFDEALYQKGRDSRISARTSTARARRGLQGSRPGKIGCLSEACQVCPNSRRSRRSATSGSWNSNGAPSAAVDRPDARAGPACAG